MKSWHTDDFHNLATNIFNSNLDFICLRFSENLLFHLRNCEKYVCVFHVNNQQNQLNMNINFKYQ